MSAFSEISKRVGWDRGSMRYPSVQRVREAIESKNMIQLLSWYRFLPSPENELQVEVIDLIYAAFNELKKEYR
jgi:hypothetical protein